MTRTIPVSTVFGSFCASGSLAVAYRVENVDPTLRDGEKVIFDFSGVRNMSSSFCNALIAGAISQCPSATTMISFQNCRPGLEVLIRAAVDLGESGSCPAE